MVIPGEKGERPPDSGAEMSCIPQGCQTQHLTTFVQSQGGCVAGTADGLKVATLPSVTFWHPFGLR